jgi:predicted SAM-dependent methyltransferase
MVLMEIGPSHRPIAPKADGWMTTVVDHASRADLAKKYAEHDVDLSQLEEVDVVWDGGDLAAQAPSERRANYDAIIASHVLEHIPDPISFLISAHALLKPGGMILLALPDKRYCFDFFAPLTSTGDWLSAYEIKARTQNKRAAVRAAGRWAARLVATSWLFKMMCAELCHIALRSSLEAIRNGHSSSKTADRIGARVSARNLYRHLRHRHRTRPRRRGSRAGCAASGAADAR